MIAEYMLITGLLFMFLGFISRADDLIGTIIKTLCWCFVAWSCYALFGPMNIAATFIK